MRSKSSIPSLTAGLIIGFLAIALSNDVRAQNNAKSNQVVDASNELGMQLLGDAVRDKTKNNILLSPLSASLALSLVYNGAKGATQVAMQKALYLQGIDVATLNESNAALLTHLLQGTEKLKLEIASSIWLREKFNVLPEFSQVAQQYYGSAVTSLDFSAPTAAPAINAWAKQKTHDKIDSIVPPTLPAQLQMLIASATYFKADWTSPFKARSTQPAPFHLADGRQENVATMSATRDAKYFEDENVQALELPYAQGEASMIVILPKESARALAETDLVSGGISQIIDVVKSANVQHGSLLLPKFSFNFDQDLRSVLAKLGMGVAFSNSADFTAISSGNLQITEVVQKTFIAVDEKGTEAAAITSIGVGIKAVQQKQFTMRVDHPFYFAIKDNLTGALLFVGKVVDPNITR